MVVVVNMLCLLVYFIYLLYPPIMVEIMVENRTKIQIKHVIGSVRHSK